MLYRSGKSAHEFVVQKWVLPMSALVVAATFSAVTATQLATGLAAPPTFTRDVAPILYAHCVECHRAGEIAPMSLVTYAEARPWAGSIAQRARDGVMPP